MDWFFSALHIWLLLSKASAIILIVMFAAGAVKEFWRKTARPEAFFYRAFNAVLLVLSVLGGVVAMALAIAIPPHF